MSEKGTLIFAEIAKNRVFLHYASDAQLEDSRGGVSVQRTYSGRTKTLMIRSEISSAEVVAAKSTNEASNVWVGRVFPITSGGFAQVVVTGMPSSRCNSGKICGCVWIHKAG